MKKFLITLSFELNQMIHKKSLIVTNIIICAIIVIVMLIPSFLSSNNENVGIPGKDKIYIVNQTQTIKNKGINENLTQYEFVFLDSIEELKTTIKEQSHEIGIVLEDEDCFSIYNGDFTTNSAIVESTFKNFLLKQYQNKQIQELGYDIDNIRPILDHEIQVNKNTIQGTTIFNAYVFVFIFIIYIMIITVGTQVALNVANERSSRIIEILATSTSPTPLICGKVMAFVVLGIGQITLWISLFLFMLNINRSSAIFSLLHFPLEAIILFFTFGLLGFIMYCFLFGVCGAMCSKNEEVNSAVTPIILIFVISFLIINTFLSQDNQITRFLFYFPLTSFLQVFSSLAHGSYSIMEWIISFVILFITTVLIVKLCAYLYRRVTLNYGNSFRWKNVVQLLKKEK